MRPVSRGPARAGDRSHGASPGQLLVVKGGVSEWGCWCLGVCVTAGGGFSTPLPLAPPSKTAPRPVKLAPAQCSGLDSCRVPPRPPHFRIGLPQRRVAQLDQVLKIVKTFYHKEVRNWQGNQIQLEGRRETRGPLVFLFSFVRVPELAVPFPRRLPRCRERPGSSPVSLGTGGAGRLPSPREDPKSMGRKAGGCPRGRRPSHRLEKGSDGRVL